MDKYSYDDRRYDLQNIFIIYSLSKGKECIISEENKKEKEKSKSNKKIK